MNPTDEYVRAIREQRRKRRGMFLYIDELPPSVDWIALYAEICQGIPEDWWDWVLDEIRRNRVVYIDFGRFPDGYLSFRTAELSGRESATVGDA